jgi:hypothetical protein
MGVRCLLVLHPVKQASEASVSDLRYHWSGAEQQERKGGARTT